MSETMQVEATFGARERQAAAHLINLALSEDLSVAGDLTCEALISPEESATVQVVSRKEGVLSGSLIGQMVFEKLDPTVRWEALCQDGSTVRTDTVIANVSGPLASLLTGERTMLNFMTHLSGIATVARRYVDAALGTKATILDTRKTLPGWRLLEKYAVRCGGATNHRMGLYDGVLIKDNHLAAWKKTGSIADAIRKARANSPAEISLEVEVDTLEQLQDALQAVPDIVLLDNMTVDQFKQAVALRDSIAPNVLLEASGGITLERIPEIARTGVERISIGALTHSAPALDLAFDWSTSN